MKNCHSEEEHNEQYYMCRQANTKVQNAANIDGKRAAP
jgi:hypothetical protein